MEETPTLRQRFTGPLTLSIAAHLVGALLFGAAFGHAVQAASSTDVQDERSFWLTVQHRPKTVRPKPPRAVELPKRELARLAPAIAVATSAATPDDLHRAPASQLHPESVGTAGRQAPIAMPDFRMTAAPPTYSPTSAPASAPPPPTSAPAARAEIPNGGWGQNFERPIVADDGALAEVRDRFRALGAVKIDVDETGRATRITILARQIGPQMRTELEQALLALRFVAAECNGLRCAGSLELRL